MSARDMREACARACLRAADECPGTEDEVATWREAVMWCVNAIRALPLAPAPDPIAAPANDAVRSATERVVNAWRRMDAHGSDAELRRAVDALYEAWTDAAERAASDEKGGERG